MNVVNGRQTRKTDVTAVLQHAQFTPNLEALRKVHGGPPATLALGEGGASQHRVIGTDPAAQNHLRSQQGHRAPQGPTHPLAQTDRRQTPGRPGVLHRLNAQQRQEHQPTDQMQCHDGGEQLHGDRERTKRALQTDPDEGERRPPGTASGRPSHRSALPLGG